MPRDQHGLGPEQLSELVLDVLVELVDGGVRRDLQNVLLGRVPVDDTAEPDADTALALVETATSILVAEPDPGSVVAEPARGTELAVPTVVAGVGTIPGAVAGALAIAAGGVATPRTGTIAIPAARVTIATERPRAGAGAASGITVAIAATGVGPAVVP
ncbi:hypothetical protein ABH920_006981 [Catenulispora sp. EB89]|uniref:hypothetical protein n=1 Tax=Catenulispora sp. EB89 TaxID=3156257 RepID=UPI003513F058